MMISPESYYEEYLKGKTREQIMTTIRGLKQEIGRLKNTMEGPEYGIKEIMHPSEDTRLHWTREYLERARQAYAEAGGTYTLSKSEKKAADFDANIDAICKITFSIGGFFGGYRSYVVELTNGLKAYTKLWKDDDPLVLLNDNKEPFIKDTIIAALKELHISEWRSGMATVFLTNFIRCRTSFRMLFRLSLTMSLLGCDDLRQELTVKVRLPR